MMSELTDVVVTIKKKLSEDKIERGDVSNHERSYEIRDLF